MTQDFETRAIVVVGAGRLGRTLTLVAREHGIDVAATWNRTSNSADETAELVDGDIPTLHGDLEEALGHVPSPRIIWLTVVDDAVQEVAEAIAPHVMSDDVVLHSSGVASSDALRDAGLKDCHVGTVHVLQAITEPRRAIEGLSDSTWSVEGSVEAVAFARWFLSHIDVEPLVIDGDAKILYHASAVTAANLLVALMDAAFDMGELAGLSREQAREILLPLARSSIENVERQPSTVDALSGPVARGDMTTLEKHRKALSEGEDPELMRIYDVLTRRASGMIERAVAVEDGESGGYET